MSLLSDSQMRVFSQIVLLKLSSIGKIAQATGFHRQSVRIILDALEKRGFIRVEKIGNRYMYSAGELSAIKSNYLSGLQQLKSRLPSLKALYEETKGSQTANTLSGRLGLRTVLIDEIIKGKEIYAFHLSPIREDYRLEYAANDMRRQRQGIAIKIIASKNIYKSMRGVRLSSIKKTNKTSKIDIFIYADKITVFYNLLEARIFTIKIPELTRLFYDLFVYHWRSI